MRRIAAILAAAVLLVLLSLAWSRLSAWLAVRELRHAYQARPLFSAHERAAYVLREAFDYPYSQIAGILQSTEPAVRQLVSRARRVTTGPASTVSRSMARSPPVSAPGGRSSDA